MSFYPVDEIKVGLKFTDETIPVGRLASRDGVIYFEYDASFLKKGLEISPLKLKLESGVKSFDSFLFEGLPGVFNDSLPDGWGLLLFDRSVRSAGFSLSEVTPLDRLAHAGLHGTGALVYEPEQSIENTESAIDLDTLNEHMLEVLEGEAQDVLQELLSLNGSSAGARPKALIGVDESRKNLIHGKRSKKGYEPWIVKFSNTNDGRDAGAIEYVYALMAKEAGLDMTEVYLFPALKNAGYFATKRFDREGEKRFHMHSVCGLLHADFRAPSLDYEDLINLTGFLTRDVREVEKMFRMAVFNVLSHNRDDHSKNFSFLMNKTGEWKLSPAYDLTFSSGPRGEQSTLVMGEGRNPNKEHLIKLSEETGIPKNKTDEIIDQTLHALSHWESLAKKYGVKKDNIELIKRSLI